MLIRQQFLSDQRSLSCFSTGDPFQIIVFSFMGRLFIPDHHLLRFVLSQLPGLSFDFAAPSAKLDSIIVLTLM
jgi:hypothetical protein